MIKNIGIFCGSSMGKLSVYREQAALLGAQMAEAKLDLIFGGGSIGLMRIIADEMLKHRRCVVGVIPHFLAAKDIAHSGITEMITVDDMHQRKQRIMELSDAFIAMPGGFGTLDEISEVLTGFQLNTINKPLALYNVNNYFGHLLHLLDVMVTEGFLRQEHRLNIIVEDNPEMLIDKLLHFHPVEIPHHWVKELIEDTGRCVGG
ncbi:MAG: TIGR00730 family Rossman fold protein [Bacteroidales bacterium]|nr:TIGR00730 family Rossman fold protein [Bacteroidales bacterium]